MKLYLSGPMSGKPNYNRDEFNRVAALLRSQGDTVINPAELDDRALRESNGGQGALWEDYLARDVSILLTDPQLGGIAMLPGWETSRGATLELLAAKRRGLQLLKIAYQDAQRDGAKWEESAPLELRPLEVVESLTEKVPEDARPLLPPCGGSLSCGIPPGEIAFRALEVAVPSTGGHKDGGLRYDLLPAYALARVAEVYTAGAKKYAPNNWRKGYPWSKSLAALQRHVEKFRAGESLDGETNCHHLAAAAFHALALMEFERTHPELDDRFGDATEAAKLAELIEQHRVKDRA